MIFFRNIRERIKLLEYENELLRREINEIKKQLKPMPPIPPFGRLIREDGWDLSYQVLKQRHRK